MLGEHLRTLRPEEVRIANHYRGRMCWVPGQQQKVPHFLLLVLFKNPTAPQGSNYCYRHFEKKSRAEERPVTLGGGNSMP